MGAWATVGAGYLSDGPVHLLQYRVGLGSAADLGLDVETSGTVAGYISVTSEGRKKTVSQFYARVIEYTSTCMDGQTKR